MRLLPAVTGLDSMHLETNKSIPTKENLSVLIHQNGLSFFTYTGDRLLNRLDHHFSAPANPVSILKKMESLFDEAPALQSDFDRVNLFYHHEMFTLVPTEYFEPQSASDYLKYNVHLLSNDVLSHDTGVAQDQIVLVYIAYENINNYFFNKYGQFEYFHYSSCLINHGKSLQQTENSQVILELFATDFYLSVFKNGALISHNLFKHEAVEDVLYYVMFSIQQNELDPNSLQCILKSEEELSKVYDLLYHYIRNVVVEEDYNTYLTQLLCV